MSQESEFEELLESAYHHTINEFGLENVKDNVGLLGHAGQLEWTRSANGLTVRMPGHKPCDHTSALKIR